MDYAGVLPNLRRFANRHNMGEKIEKKDEK